MAKDSLRFLGIDAGQVDINCDILDKHTSTYNYIQYMFDRTNRMFKYTGLPDTIPEPIFEYMLQIYGSVAIVEYKDSLYAMMGRFGGPPDPYYRPTICVIANPALPELQGTYRVYNHLPPADKASWEEYPPCIRFLNDSQIMGLVPLFARYAVQMTENDISIRSAQINSRQQSVIAADSGPDIESANAYIKQLEAGVPASIQKRALTDGISVFNTSSGNSNTIMQLIELQQYLKASWYNEIGLNSNFNMKRQYVSSEEINSTADIMLPLIDNLYHARVMHCEAVNNLFGTHISVEKDSAWAKKQMQSDLSVASPADESLSPSSTLVVQSPELDQPDEQNQPQEQNQSQEPTQPQEETNSISETALEVVKIIEEAVSDVLEGDEVISEGGDNNDRELSENEDS